MQTAVVAVVAALVALTTGILMNDDRQACSLCGPPIDVTLTAVSEIALGEGRGFNVSVTLRHTAQRELVFLLQEAADIDGRFNFTVSYHKNLGFMIQTINKQSGDWTNEGTWWHTYTSYSATNGPGAHCEGVSSYVPDHKESVVFLLTSRTINLPDCP